MERTMSNRRRNVLPIAGHKISDKSRLLWERYVGPMQGAAAALNAAIVNTQNVLAGIIVEAEGFTAETHQFDIDRLVVVPRKAAVKLHQGGV